MTASTDRTLKVEDLASPPLPKPWPDALLPEIAQRVASQRVKIVVLDDDPTGTQTVHGIPVLTRWSVRALAQELCSPYPAFYILTNSRSLTESEAVRLNMQIGANLKEAAQRRNTPVEVISRSDSTLRGHFPAEVTALARSMDLQSLPWLLVPCFFEGGRFTHDDIHYVAENGWLIPAARTSYANDAAFGYRHSNLRQWVEEKTGGRYAKSTVASVSLSDIREKGPRGVAADLCALPAGAVCVVNAVSYRDLEVVVQALLDARAQGKRFLYRTAASFVRVRCGIAPRELLHPADLAADNPHGGLFLVGSYVPKTTEQVDCLKRRGGLRYLEIDVTRLLDGGRRAAVVSRAVGEMNRWIASGQDVLIYTSRELVKGAGAQGSLDIGRRISDSLIDIVKGLRCQPRYLVAKGGITSSDVATDALGVKRAMVLGQVLPGVPVWQLGEESRYPGMAYIVFPGNVGEPDALAVIKHRMQNGLG